MSITIKDISRATGKSYPTVSRALNDDPRISQVTRTMIQEAAHRLGYTRNRAARLLKDGRTGIIGICLPSPSSYFYAELAAELHRAVKESGYSPIFAFWSNDQEQALATQSVLDWNPEGIITLEPRLVPSTCSVPVISYNKEDSRFDCILFDYDAEVKSLVKELDQRGHRDIVWLGNRYDCRIKLLQSYAPQYGMTVETLCPAHDAPFIIFENAEQLFDQLVIRRGLDHLPTAIVTIHDMAATSIISRMATYGLSCPSDISVIGSDDLQLASRFLPSITTFQRGISSQITDLLVQRLVTRIHEPDRPRQKTILPTKLILRDSLGDAPLRS